MTQQLGRYLSFDSVADDYDQTRVIPNAQLDAIANICIQEAKLDKYGLFLDAGVGTGRFAAPMAQLCPGQIVGLDISTLMMAQVNSKVAPDSLSLVNGDLLRLPFRTCAFQGALLVHILHLIENWKLVLDEIRRVIAPKSGVLLLGSEQGGRSVLVDYYYDRARAMGVLPSNIGAAGFTEVLSHLRRADRPARPPANITLLSTPHLAWKRTATAADTLAALGRATYSQMWTIPETTRQLLLQDTTEYARRTFGDLNTLEVVDARFVIYSVRWPSW